MQPVSFHSSNFHIASENKQRVNIIAVISNDRILKMPTQLWNGSCITITKKSRHYFVYDALSSINIFEFQLQLYWKLFPSVKLKYTSNGMDNGLVPNMREAIIWTSDGRAYGRRFPSLNLAELAFWLHPQIAKFKGPTWGPTGSCRPQVGPMLAPGTLLSGSLYWCSNPRPIFLRFRWREYGLSHWEKLFLLRLLPSTETILALLEKTNQGPATMVIEWSGYLCTILSNEYIPYHLILIFSDKMHEYIEGMIFS